MLRSATVFQSLIGIIVDFNFSALALSCKGDKVSIPHRDYSRFQHFKILYVRAENRFQSLIGIIVDFNPIPLIKEKIMPSFNPS